MVYIEYDMNEDIDVWRKKLAKDSFSPRYHRPYLCKKKEGNLDCYDDMKNGSNWNLGVLLISCCDFLLGFFFCFDVQFVRAEIRKSSFLESFSELAFSTNDEWGTREKKWERNCKSWDVAMYAVKVKGLIKRRSRLNPITSLINSVSWFSCVFKITRNKKGIRV